MSNEHYHLFPYVPNIETDKQNPRCFGLTRSWLLVCDLKYLYSRQGTRLDEYVRRICEGSHNQYKIRYIYFNFVSLGLPGSVHIIFKNYA